MFTVMMSIGQLCRVKLGGICYWHNVDKLDTELTKIVIGKYSTVSYTGAENIDIVFVTDIVSTHLLQTRQQSNVAFLCLLQLTVYWPHCAVSVLNNVI